MIEMLDHLERQEDAMKKSTRYKLLCNVRMYFFIIVKLYLFMFWNPVQGHLMFQKLNLCLFIKFTFSVVALLHRE